MKFHAIIELHGKTATAIEVPNEVIDSLQSGKRPPIRVTINGYTYRSAIASMDGRFLIPVSAENRERAHVSAGDKVEVEVELDKEPREITVPTDLTEALNQNNEARQAFDVLSRSAKQRIILSVEGAKTVETRSRRVTKAISDLQGGHS